MNDNVTTIKQARRQQAINGLEAALVEGRKTAEKRARSEAVLDQAIDALVASILREADNDAYVLRRVIKGIQAGLRKDQTHE